MVVSKDGWSPAPGGVLSAAAICPAPAGPAVFTDPPVDGAAFGAGATPPQNLAVRCVNASSTYPRGVSLGRTETTLQCTCCLVLRFVSITSCPTVTGATSRTTAPRGRRIRVCVSSANVSRESAALWTGAPGCNPRTRTGISLHTGLAVTPGDSGFNTVGEEDDSAFGCVGSAVVFASVLMALPGEGRPSGILIFNGSALRFF